jgi:hypothetical protein
MAYRWLTDLTVTVHFAFLVFVIAGGLAVRRYRRIALPHLLAVAWAVYVESKPGLICPLTPLENHFAIRAGRAGYEGSFIEHHLVPIIYPEGLTPGSQLALAALVVGVNAIVYVWPLVRSYRSRQPLAAQPRGAATSLLNTAPSNKRGS